MVLVNVSDWIDFSIPDIKKMGDWIALEIQSRGIVSN
jgi:hypothetical protein